MSASRPARARFPVRALLLLALFALAFWLSTAALRPRLAGRASNLTETKLAWFAEHGGAFDTLFFGSSRAYRGFDPETFDRLTAEAGVPTRSFNFGSPASRGFDVQRMLQRLGAAGALDGVRWVLVDPEPLPWLLRAKDKESMLARGPIDWHDPATTWLVLRYVWSLDEATFGERLAASVEHLHSMCYFVAGIGSTENLINTLIGKDLVERSELTDRLGPRLDGWLPLEEASGDREVQNQRFLSKKRQREYREDLEERRAESVDERPVEPAAAVFFTRLEQTVRALGATPVFVTQPSLNLQEDLVKAHREGLVAHLLRYDDPDEPRLFELFAPENRWDKFHLARPGARLFTELLARDFAALALELEPRP